MAGPGSNWAVERDGLLGAEAHFGRTFPCYRDRPRQLWALHRAALERDPSAEALVAGDWRLSYADLDRLAAFAAGNLSARGIRRGDRVALLLGNCAEFLVLLLACIRLGAVAVPLGTRLKAVELGALIGDCGAAGLVFEREFAANLPPPSALPSVRLSLCLERTGMAGAGANELLRPAAAPPPVMAGEEETAAILYTSGTTGRPKGAMLTHLGIIHSAINFERCLGLAAGDRAILTVPASHVTGLVAILFTMLRCGGCTIMMRSFKAKDFIALAARERMSYTVMVPAQYNLCLLQEDLERHDLSAWRIGAFGGAPMPEATIAALAERLPSLCLVNAYGATETTSPTSIMPPGQNAAHLDSVGRIVPGGAVRIVGEDGRDVPPGEAGEIWIKGPMVVPGYWRRPDANAAEFIDGFWRSGDIGSLDGEGFLRVFDRKKDMINRAGYKVFSAEVENVLSHHPAVVESAVIGVPDPVLGERVKAVVVDREASLTAAEIRAFCAERLADYKVPEIVELRREPLPRNANGKLQKALLRAAAQNVPG